MNRITSLLLFASIGLPSAFAQFHVRFDDPSFTGRGYEAVYSFESGQLLMLTDNDEARNDGYIFLNSETGAKLSSFSLDRDHGALLTPDGSELLIAGSDGSHRTMGRYDPATLTLNAKVGIDLGDTLANTIGIGGHFEPVPNGAFVFVGTDIPAEVNFIIKYDLEFQEEWATSFTYNGSYSFIGVAAYPLPGGDIGFYVFFNQQNETTQQLETVDLFGLLDGETGDLKWTFSYRPPLGANGNRLENFRYVFGSDGSFFAHAAVTLNVFDINAPVDYSKAKVLRINPDGTLAYSKTLEVSEAVVIGEHYMDGYAMLHFSFDDEDNTQFVVLDSNGNITGNTAVGNHLSAGDGDLTATRRSGTDFAFVRATYTFPSGETLARLDLTNGDMEFRRLPSPFPGAPAYEAVGTSESYPVAPFNTPRGLSGVSRVLAAEIFQAFNADPQMELIELPIDGSFPTCITYTTASITEVTPRQTTAVDTEIIDLEDGWTISAYGGFGGFASSDLEPELLAMDVAVEIICEDDGVVTINPGEVSLLRINATEGELTFPTAVGATYRVQRRTSVAGGEVTTVETVVGDGEVFEMIVPLEGAGAYYQYELEVTAP